VWQRILLQWASEGGSTEEGGMKHMSQKAGMIEIGSKKELNKIVNEHKTVLVDFGANWCQPCRTTHMQLEKLIEEGVLDGTLVAQVDIEKSMELAEAFNINSIPVLMFFKNGKVIKQQVGGTGLPKTRETLTNWMKL
jgi:thioredoxin 1